MRKLIHLLNEFNRAQIAKFIAVEHKHPNDSVTTDDWSKWDWDSIRKHFLDEIKELLEAPHDPKELIDIGNIAFLLWCFEARRI